MWVFCHCFKFENRFLSLVRGLSVRIGLYYNIGLYFNIQYSHCRVTLEDVDEDDDEDVCTLIVSLMQVGRRKLRRKLGANANLTIGFAIYKVKLVTIVFESIFPFFYEKCEINYFFCVYRNFEFDTKTMLISNISNFDFPVLTFFRGGHVLRKCTRFTSYCLTWLRLR